MSRPTPAGFRTGPSNPGRERDVSTTRQRDLAADRPHVGQEHNNAELATAHLMPGGVIPPPLRGLPLASLSYSHGRSDTYYVVTTIDSRGRLADRSPLRIMRWWPGTQIRISATLGKAVVYLDPASQESITPQGHLRLRPTVRRVCRVEAGERLLVAAYADRRHLIVLTMPLLDAMLQAQDPRLFGKAIR
jgi:hypothetical protein